MNIDIPKGFTISKKDNSIIYKVKLLDYHKLIFISFIGLLISIFSFFSLALYKFGTIWTCFILSWIWISLNNTISLKVLSKRIIIKRGYSIFRKKIDFLKKDLIDVIIKSDSSNDRTGYFLYGSKARKSHIKYLLILTSNKNYKFFNNLSENNQIRFGNLIKHHCTQN